MNQKDLKEIKKKKAIFEHAEKTGNIAQTCRYFGISRMVFYKCKKKFQSKGEEGLIPGKPCPVNLKLRISAEIEEKILYLRKNYHFGQLKISWYLARYTELKFLTVESAAFY